MRKNPQVQIAPCNSHGKASNSYLDARARFLKDNEEDLARKLLRKKYIIYRMVEFLHFWGKNKEKKRVYLEISAIKND